MWHFVMIVCDGARASFYLDGSDEFSFGGGGSTRTWVGFPASGPPKMEFGASFLGLIDEVKMYRRAVTFTELMGNDLMYARGLPSAPAEVFAYYRFNNVTEYIDPLDKVIRDEFERYDGVVDGGAATYKYEAMAVPWEPSIVYEVNDADVTERFAIQSAPQTGMGGDVEVEGFNFAKSFATGCVWGVDREMAATTLMVPVEETFNETCVIPDAEALDINPGVATETFAYGEGMLGRVDGKQPLMQAYPVSMVSTAGSVAFSAASFVSEDGTSMRCPAAMVDKPQFATFTAGAGPTLSAVPFEFTEVALGCEGDNYLQADEMNQNVGNKAYTLALWVMPAVPDHTLDEEAPASPAARRRRSLLSTDKNLRRKLMGHEGKVASTVWAFESEGKNDALLMYDGERFFYYDDCILDVTQTGAPAAPGEWHYVAVSVDLEGNAILNVDGFTVEEFTTTCKPKPTGTFSLCQDFEAASGGLTAASYFVGMVDEVKLWDREMDNAMTMTYMFEPYDFVLAGPVGHYAFKDAGNMLPNLAALVGNDNPWKQASGPWLPATVVATHPEVASVSGGTQVSVYGTNFAPSPHLRVAFGEEIVTVDAFLPSGVVATAGHGDCDGNASAAVLNLDPNVVTPEYADLYFGALANDVAPAEVEYVPTVDDLAKDVFARFTFDLTAGVTDEKGEFFVSFDLANPVEVADMADLDPSAGVAIPGSSNFFMPAERMVPDKDEFEKSALRVGGGYEAPIPVPPGAEYTLAAWLFLDLVEPHPPMGGAWKLVSLTQHADGTHSVHMNGEEVDAATTQYYVAALSDFTLGNNEAGVVDEVWVYSRALLQCELRALYYTQEFALDFAKRGDALLTAPATLALPVPAGPLRFTMSMWVYPFKTEGLQTLASTDGARMFNTQDRSLGLTFGLYDNSLSFDVHKGCTCQPCPGLISLTSHKAKVVPYEWNHVSFAFPFGHEFAGMEETTMAIYVDGILRDIKEIPNVEIPDVPEDTVLELLLGQHSTDPLNFQPFEGMVYDVRWSHAAMYNYQVKKMMQCPPKAREEAETYYELDVGSGAVDASGAAMGLAGLWTNTSYDDPTSPASVTFYGDMQNKTAGAVGRFVITSRTACQKKRVVGGDDYAATLTHPDGTVQSLDVVDANDGNYHVEYTDITCGTYAASVALAGEQLNTFDIAIVPGPTDPTRTFIVDQLPTPSCFGAVTEFMIQAQDNYGCAQVGHDDVFVLKLNGPHAADAVVTPVADTPGRYKVSFVPEAPGDYHLTLYMQDPATGEAKQIMDGMYFCISVCGEGALELSSALGVLVPEDLPGKSDLDLDFPGVTMEMWFKLPAGTNFPLPEGTPPIYLLHKGGPDQHSVAAYTKTYDLLIKDSGEIEANVYVAPRNIRDTRLPADDAKRFLEVQDQWIHIAAVYTGFEFFLMINGEKVTSTAFPDAPMPVKHNYYDHPLEMGANMAGGKIDEVKLWKVARTPEQVKDAMYCPPYQFIDHVAAYFSFNEGTGAVAAGHGAQCPHTSLSAHNGLCLQGAVPEGALFTEDTPVATAGEGFNAPSPRYSLLMGPGLTVYPAGSTDLQYQVMARDKCNYAWIKDSPEAYAATTAEYKIEYASEVPPVEGVEYPAFAVSTTKSAPVFASPPPTRQCPGDPAPGPYLGDVYNATFATADLAPTTVSGTYSLEITVDSVVHESYPRLITVIANDPDHFSVLPVDSGLFAGVPAAFSVQMKDAHDNTIYDELELTAHVSLLAAFEGTPTPYDTTAQGDVVKFDPETGFYTVAVRLGYPGTYSLVLAGAGEAAAMTAFSMSFTVNEASWRPMLTDDLEVPPHSKRFEHTAAVYEDDLYIFGGALYDRTYLNDMWKLSNVATDNMLSFKETLMFEYALAEEKDLTVEVRVDTASRIAASQMNPSCLDVVFTLPNNGALLDFYLDPAPGCNSESTLYWVRLPAGAVKPEGSTQLFEMYYGNAEMGVSEPNVMNDPHKVFLMYEGFENLAATTGAFMPGETACRADPEDAAQEAYSTFGISDSLPFAGNQSLRAEWGKTGMLVWKAPMPVHGFKLRAWFYDSAATHSTHFISPDFAECDVKEGDKFVLPMAHGPLEAVSTAVGTYTLAKTDKYCIASPWESATADPAAGTQTVFRTAGWHQFEVTSAYGRLVVAIDGKPVKNVSSAEGETTLEHVMLSAGFTEGQVAAAGQNDNHAFWDEISVVLVEDGVGPVSSTNPEGPEAVALSGERVWSKVEAHNPPPPRYAHSAVVHDATMYVFGGERSAYAFNDVWAYSFAEEKWSFVTPTAGPAPAPRYDHTAAVTADGVMVIYGGRSGAKVMGDMWAFDLRNHTWSLIRDEASQDAGARFGHAAAIPPNSHHMYVFGGYKAESGFAGDFLQCDVATGECADLSAGCPTTEVRAGDFLPASMVARYEHAAFATERFFYVYGGVSLTEKAGFSGVYKFAIAECSWEQIPTQGLPVGRYEHVAGLVEGGMYVHGGHADGDFVDDTYFFPL
uniref:Attractin/MKLN-like beta-propeller domain-containing protein n=1 Tax=Pyramimonas obovata TaxID=1411642 RepID=A0A7S0N023_9CHLO